MADAFAFGEVIRALLPMLDTGGESDDGPRPEAPQAVEAVRVALSGDGNELRALLTGAGVNLATVSVQDVSDVLAYVCCADAVDLNGDNKFRIKRNGILLVLAYCVEGLQRVGMRG